MKNRLSFLMAIGLLGINLTIGQNQWISLSSAPNETLTSVYFVSADTGYISTFGGKVYKTTNGGSTISQVNNNGPAFSLYFPNAHKGFGARDNYILITQNSGATWTSNYTNPDFMEINNICFPDKKHGFATAFSNDAISYVLRSNNGGISWDTIVFHDPNYPFFKSIFFQDSLNGFLGSDIGKIYKTTDGGTTLIPADLANAGVINSIYFPTTDTGYASAYNMGVYKTIDGGNTWSHLSFNFLSDLNSVWFFDANNGFAAGGNDIGYMVFYKTVNGGNTWTQCLSGTHTIYAMQFVNNSTGYAVGSDAVFKYTTTTGIADNLPDEYTLIIYPNPATTILTIDGLTTIAIAEVYDLSGKLLLTKQLNTNQIDISTLAKGLYFIKLSIAEGSVVRKFVKE